MHAHGHAKIVHDNARLIFESTHWLRYPSKLIEKRQYLGGQIPAARRFYNGRPRVLVVGEREIDLRQTHCSAMSAGLVHVRPPVLPSHNSPA
jgi:hypothetical protein